jgi:hypothetical protein
VDELLFLCTNIRLRHQRNKTTVGRIVPSHLPTDYNGGLLLTAHNCSGFGVWVSTLREGFSATEWRYPRFDSEYMIKIDL